MASDVVVIDFQSYCNHKLSLAFPDFIKSFFYLSFPNIPVAYLLALSRDATVVTLKILVAFHSVS